MTHDLKPCPICGSGNHAIFPPTCTKNAPYDPADRVFPMIRCSHCFTEVPGDDWDFSTKSAVERWNRRPHVDKQRALIETLTKTLSAVKTWAEQRCPCENDEPNPCPLCGASVENLEACKAVDQTFPPSIKRDIFAALTAAKEITQ